jgi:5-formyltetrahydrofolate cyclo-ligase
MPSQRRDTALAGQRAALRRQLRHLRRELPSNLQRRHARAFARHALALRELRRARRIAVYWPVRAEADSRLLMQRLLHAGREVYLPVIRGGRMRFARHRDGAALGRGRFGIPQPPRPAQSLAARDLDAIIAPLLGFDDAGTRLGSGGGWYDRCLAFRLRRSSWLRPRFLGLACSAQRCPPLARASWDVPLDAVLHEHGWRRFAVP